MFFTNLLLGLSTQNRTWRNLVGYTYITFLKQSLLIDIFIQTLKIGIPRRDRESERGGWWPPTLVFPFQLRPIFQLQLFDFNWYCIFFSNKAF